ncbi:hypothetical protein SISSUDRAFT_1050981 [Sistotremastrum suecicum HHB10207 ss-3]|uniref:Arrestin-like N-terminal domain-containing protein n=1 Tax=Sistotremastrum suecicum HHB10207 ss-3 TaxID=1314776 RepID=A0A166AV82_9AGAM|nr:hypothetical protein SISSUDRAFT_1050981 [Sistotremastrum suecicum HHB10207 ss-3]
MLPRLPSSSRKPSPKSTAPVPSPNLAAKYGLSLSFSPTLKTPASGITGVLSLHLPTLQRTQVDEVFVRICGEAKTGIASYKSESGSASFGGAGVGEGGEGRYLRRTNQVFLSQSQTIYKSSSPPSAFASSSVRDDTASVPFTFHLPSAPEEDLEDFDFESEFGGGGGESSGGSSGRGRGRGKSLPPSFKFANEECMALIRYFLQVHVALSPNAPPPSSSAANSASTSGSTPIARNTLQVPPRVRSRDLERERNREATGVRSGETSKVVLSCPFLFLPLDETPPPSITTYIPTPSSSSFSPSSPSVAFSPSSSSSSPPTNSSSPRTQWTKSIPLRTSLLPFTSHGKGKGKVTVSLDLPELWTIPLFQAVPLRLTIQCLSEVVSLPSPPVSEDRGSSSRSTSSFSFSSPTSHSSSSPSRTPTSSESSPSTSWSSSPSPTSNPQFAAHYFPSSPHHSPPPNSPRSHSHSHSHSLPRSPPRYPRYPNPPTLPSQIEIKLICNARIRVGSTTRIARIPCLIDSGFGPSLNSESQSKSRSGTGRGKSKMGLGREGRDDDVIISEPRWFEEPCDAQSQRKKKEKGGNERWSGRYGQEIVFESSVVFRCAPCLRTRYISTSYELQIRIPFRGPGNDIIIRAGPLSVSSGIYRGQMIQVVPVVEHVDPVDGGDRRDTLGSDVWDGEGEGDEPPAYEDAVAVDMRNGAGINGSGQDTEDGHAGRYDPYHTGTSETSMSLGTGYA